VVDRLQAIAADHQTTVAELAIGWALSQPGVRGALVGAKSPEQIRETAGATPLAAEVLAKVNQLVS
jgi:aryl-alcohol dehydrogenase-like predicted oxidoreductase